MAMGTTNISMWDKFSSIGRLSRRTCHCMHWLRNSGSTAGVQNLVRLFWIVRVIGATGEFRHRSWLVVQDSRLRSCEHHTCTVDDRCDFKRHATSNLIGEMVRSKFSGVGHGPKPGMLREFMRTDHQVLITY